MTIELKTGQTYRTRNGKLVKIDLKNEKTPGARTYPFFGDNYQTYTKDGKVLPGRINDEDLVELVSVTAPSTRRRFVSITRTDLPDGFIIDAIDDDGVAWWRFTGTSPEKDVDWTRLTPLPDRNPEDAS